MSDQRLKGIYEVQQEFEMRRSKELIDDHPFGIDKALWEAAKQSIKDAKNCLDSISFKIPQEVQATFRLWDTVGEDPEVLREEDAELLAEI